ncbi:hypothetical protein LCGC14_2613270, partial [marine sediment metagenome]
NSSTEAFISDTENNVSFINNIFEGNQPSHITNGFAGNFTANFIYQATPTLDSQIWFTDYHNSSISNNQLHVMLNFASSENNTISKNILNFGNREMVGVTAITLTNGISNIISDNNISDHSMGISLFNEDNSTIVRNNIDIKTEAIVLSGSRYNNISSNLLRAENPLSLRSISSYNQVLYNTINATEVTSIAIRIDNSRANRIVSNQINSLGDGVYFDNMWSGSRTILNQFVNNTVKAKSLGVRIYESHYAANIINNTILVEDSHALRLDRVRQYNLIKGNNLTSIHDLAIWSDVGQFVEIIDNFIWSIENKAFFAWRLEKAQVINNTISGKQIGLEIRETVNSDFINNTIISTDASGIAMSILLQVRDFSYNRFIANSFVGTTANTVSFEILDEDTEYTVGDTILIDSNYTIFYQWNTDTAIYETDAEIFVDRTDATMLDIWVENQWKDKWVRQILFEIHK